MDATTNAILELADYLVALQIEKVVLESTSDYWRPFFYLLEAGGLTVELVNARDVKNAPGCRRPTNWMRCRWPSSPDGGMLRPSFVPPPEIRQLRDYTRLRTDLTRERARHWLRVQGANHPDTLATRANLATWRGRAGDAAGAAAAFEDLLADNMRVLGRDSPKTLATRANLATWRGRAGDAGGAAAAFEDLLTDNLRVHGPDHPHTLSARASLATWQRRVGPGRRL